MPKQEGRLEVPEVVVERLPLYVRALKELAQRQVEVVSSKELGERLHTTPAQIRKDLSSFGRFGKQGRGYSVRTLLTALQQILGLDREWHVAVIGVGRLGRAIISYPGFAPEGFKVVAALDNDPRQIGQVIGGLMVQPIEELPRLVKEQDIQITIVAVPREHAQEVIDLAVQAGVRAILNYAPITPRVPNGVRVQNIDPVLSLQAMTYYLVSGERRPLKTPSGAR
ncbi:Redox-sensing transcriptional repressor Rex [bacterium HR23]|nr:Redox-sensing transcriptional repressor Rex [bacterium HR23]